MPRDAKRPEDRQRRNLPAVLAGSGDVPVVSGVPAPPSGLSDALRRAWSGLWTSPVAQLLDSVSDLPAVTRLFRLYAAGEWLDDRMASGDVDEFDSVVATRT